jgi:hypothetical protein
MDVVIRGFMRRFQADFGLEGLNDDDLFESFATYCAIRRYYKGPFIPDECRIGGGAGAIDAAAVIVNGILFADPQKLKEYLTEQPEVDARFVIVHAQPGGDLPPNVFARLADDVKLLFGPQPTLLAATPELDRFAACIEVVYSERPRFRNDSPVVSAYCITPGRPSSARMSTTPSTAAKELKGLGLFASIEVESVDADALKVLFHRTHTPVEATMTMAQFITLPAVPSVDQVHLGVVSAQELVDNVLSDDRGHIRPWLFYDNVRSYLQSSPVNREMAQTLRTKHGRFSIMNNGITIVAGALDILDGNRFALREFYVVNGCQTCHVLHANKTLLDESTRVTVRVIVTDDDDVIDDVVKGSNRQTTVTLPTLDARKPFQKELEDYFAAQAAPRQLLYERRVGQYGAGPIARDTLPLSAAPVKTKAAGLPRSRIMQPETVARAFVSAFKSEAWRASSGSAFPERVVFRSAPVPDAKPFYTAASILFAAEDLLSNRKLPADFRSAKYHLVAAAKSYLVGADAMPAGTGERSAQCETILDAIWDPAQAVKVFDVAMSALRNARDLTFPNGEAYFSARMVKSRGFAAHVVRIASEMRDR